MRRYKFFQPAARRGIRTSSFTPLFSRCVYSRPLAPRTAPARPDGAALAPSPFSHADMRVTTARPRLGRLNLTISNCLVTAVPPCQLLPTFRWPATAARHARLPGRSRTSTLPRLPHRHARRASPTAARPPRPAARNPNCSAILLVVTEDADLPPAHRGRRIHLPERATPTPSPFIPPAPAPRTPGRSPSHLDPTAKPT